MRRSTRTVIPVVMTFAVLVSSVPAGAGGFVPKTVEEIGENTATCDFDRDGEFSDYGVTPEQVVLDNIVKQDVTDDYVHVKRIAKFDNLEYTHTTATPSVVYFTVTIISDTYVDLTTGIISLHLVMSGSITDASGDILFNGSWVAATEFIDDEPMWTTERGTPGFPCRFGF